MDVKAHTKRICMVSECGHEINLTCSAWNTQARADTIGDYG